MKQKNIRIKDIATMAGVSEGTVDRVLHKRGKVSRAATEKVNRVLAQIDYTPNLIARTLGANRTYRLVAVIPDPSLDEYWKQSFDGIKEAEADLAQFGITINVDHLYYNPHKRESFQEVTIKAFQSKPDGILAAPLFYHASISFFRVLSESKIPYILFNTNIEESNTLSFIGQDSFLSGRLAAELVSIGQTNESHYGILHIYEDLNDSVYLKEKEQGFKNYFAIHRPETSRNIHVFNLPDPGRQEFPEAMNQVLSLPHLNGLFVSTSKAYVVAHELHKRNLSVRLVGYDLLDQNINYLKTGYIHFLIHQNPRRQAKTGIRSLANYILLGKKPPRKSLFPLEIISRYNIDSYLN
jgi:LacI family transcriptional regulator